MREGWGVRPVVSLGERRDGTEMSDGCGGGGDGDVIYFVHYGMVKE